MDAEQLQERVTALEQELQTAQNEVAAAKKSRIVISRERKLSKLAGRPKSAADPEVSDWLLDIRQHITDLDEPQKIDIIMGQISGEVREEVRLRPAEDRDTAEKILKIIEDNFKDVDSLACLNQKFFNRKQEASESVQSYSRALMKLNSRIQKKSGNALSDDTLITKFIDGLRDSSLKMELRRMSKEEDRTFSEFRQEVLQLVEDDETEAPKKEAKDRSVAAVKQEPDLAQMLQQSLQLQKTLLEELKRHSGASGSKKKTTDSTASASESTSKVDKAARFAPSSKGPCYICGKMGHVAFNCYFNKKNKKPKSDQAQQSEN
jgi:hypothetical protein